MAIPLITQVLPVVPPPPQPESLTFDVEMEAHLRADAEYRDVHEAWTDQVNATASAINGTVVNVTAATTAATTATGAATTSTTKAAEAAASAASALAAKTAAETARDTTLAARDTATGAATTATTKAGEAAGSATAAGTARTAAETARDITLAARDTTVTKAGEASDSASAAASAKTAAETARDDAVAARNVTLGARDTSVDAAGVADLRAGDAAASAAAARQSELNAAQIVTGNITPAAIGAATEAALATEVAARQAHEEAANPHSGSASIAALTALAATIPTTAAGVGLGNVTNDAQVKRSEMGAAGGVATLGLDGKVPAAQLPTITSNVSVIRTPTITSPADGATLTTSMPTIACDTYRNVYGIAQASMVVEIATDAGFANITYTHTVSGAATTYAMPTGHIAPLGAYWIGVKYTDTDGESSARGVAHVTAAAVLEHVVAPTVTAPAAGATVYEQPTLTSSAFAVSSGADTHAASQWRVKTTAGTWDSPLWDSGETASSLTSITVPAGRLVAGGNGYDMEVRHKGTILGWSDWSPSVSVVSATTFANIIGVVCTATGGGGGTWAWVDASGNATTPAAGYFNGHPVFGGITDVTVDGQAMVKIPKFYIKRATLAAGAYSGKEAWWVSDQPATGFRLHPAFYNAGAEVAQIYVGKYQASSDGTKLKSVSGVAPAVSTTLTAFQGLATARNVSGVTGFMLWSVYQWSAIQWLYLLENATMDSQTKTGQGRVSQSSAANVDATDVAQATYRGIVGLWGNVYQWMDGLKTDGTQICMWDNAGNKTWVTTGRTRTAAAGWVYPLTFMAQSGASYNFSDAFIGDTGPTSNSGATAPDGQHFDPASAYFPIVGGSWGDGAGAGLWYVLCVNSASGASTSVGARLAKV
uniref:Uncharacterized protein n=1 Tax=Desulfovibrio sp. U5L TaxID=596152 RepID=I2Q2M6_9BACT